MPFPLIPAVLAFCFLLMWALIAGMIFRDGQMAVRRDREWGADVVPMTPKRTARAALFTATRKQRPIERAVRVAS